MLCHTRFASFAERKALEEIETFPSLSQLTPQEIAPKELTAVVDQEPASTLSGAQERPVSQSSLAEQVNLTVGPFNADFRSVKLINILSLNFPILLGKSENLPLKC